MKIKFLSFFLLLTIFSTCSKEDITLTTEGEMYEDISINEIINLQGSMSDDKVNSTIGDANEIPQNTILVFRTTEGNWGKMQVLNNTVEEDYLEFRYELFNNSNELLITSDFSSVQQTYTFDFETDMQGVNGRDFWWEWEGASSTNGEEKFLVPFGDAIFHVYQN